MKNYKDSDWNLDDVNATVDSCSLAVLMDIRAELRILRQIFKCYNFQNIPRKLDRISANTFKQKKRKKRTANNKP